MVLDMLLGSLAIVLGLATFDSGGTVLALGLGLVAAALGATLIVLDLIPHRSQRRHGR